MAFTWIEGQPQLLDVEWVHLEEICEVNAEKELLSVTVRLATKDPGGGYFDDLQLYKNLTNEKLFGAESTQHVIPQVDASVLLETPVLGATRDIAVVAAYLVPREGIVGNDASYMVLRLVNKATGATICTKTFITGIDAPAYKVTPFGPVNESAASVPAGESVALVKENVGAGMTLPQMVLIIEWDLR